jgi:hypothetical protein
MDHRTGSRALIVSVLLGELVFLSNGLACWNAGVDYFLSQLVLGATDDPYTLQNLVLPRLVSGALLFGASSLFALYCFLCFGRQTTWAEKGGVFFTGTVLMAVAAVPSLVGHTGFGSVLVVHTGVGSVGPVSLLSAYIVAGGFCAWRVTALVKRGG